MADKAMLASGGYTQTNIPKAQNMDDTGGVVASIGTDVVSKRRFGILGANEVETFIEIDRPCIIDYMEWSTKKPNSQLSIIHNTGEKGGDPNNSLGVTSPSGEFIYPFRPDRIDSAGAGVFEIVIHNTTTDTYKYRLKQPLHFPKGVIIQLRSNAGDDAFFGITVSGRSF